jgi:hypothetical protein
MGLRHLSSLPFMILHRICCLKDFSGYEIKDSSLERRTHKTSNPNPAHLRIVRRCYTSFADVSSCLIYLISSYFMLSYLCLISSCLVLCYLISSHLISAYLILSPIISYYLSSYLILSYISSSLILSHPLSSHLNSSHLVLSYLILPNLFILFPCPIDAAQTKQERRKLTCG